MSKKDVAVQCFTGKRKKLRVLIWVIGIRETMIAPIHAFVTLGHLDDEKLDSTRFFQADQIADEMHNRTYNEDDFEVLRVDKHDHAHNGIDHKIHVAYAQNHGGAG